MIKDKIYYKVMELYWESDSQLEMISETNQIFGWSQKREQSFERSSKNFLRALKALAEEQGMDFKTFVFRSPHCGEYVRERVLCLLNNPSIEGWEEE
jgi:hypothetical protein